MPTTTAKAPTPKKLATRSEAARDRLDAWVREVVAWHFDTKTGTPFWLDWAKQRGMDPRKLPSFAATARERVAVYMEGLAELRNEWAQGGGRQSRKPGAKPDGKPAGKYGVPKSRPKPR